MVLGLLVGCGMPCADIESTKEYAYVMEAKQAIDDRMLVAMKAGVAEARRRGGETPTDEELPKSARLPNGDIDPVVEKYAMDGDGKLRGEGASMSQLEDTLKYGLENLKKEQDKFGLQRCIENR